MKPINPMGTAHPGPFSVGSDVGTHQGRSCPPAKGSSPKASMIDGPYGGKKPQS